MTSQYILAPLFLASSISSRTTMPAPSARIKPSLFLSNGRLAFSGASFLVERVFMALKPAIPSGVIVDSVPPAIMTSASPFFIILNASPIECVPVAHAVTAQLLGPLAPSFIDTCPAARFIITIGIKKGVILSGPFSFRILCQCSIAGSPPMPEPI